MDVIKADETSREKTAGFYFLAHPSALTPQWYGPLSPGLWNGAEHSRLGSSQQVNKHTCPRREKKDKLNEDQ